MFHSRRQPQLRPPTSSPPPVATMTVTSPPPSVSKTAVQSYSSSVQTPNKSPKVTPTPAPTANPFAPSAPRAVTPVSPGFCLPLPVPQPTSSPPPVATMAVTSPPPSVSKTAVQSYSSTVQTPNKSPKVTPTPVSPGCCLPFPVRRAQSVVSLSSTTPQSSSSPPNMGVSNDPSPSPSSGARSPLEEEQKCSAFKRKKKHKCVII
ncbi:hypothetical protein C0Q70_02513 [Pomacea canaliculata]|uniref:Uncharacterized protein n=1 Tax=Pomacea canaliculata TaxID=400727 RepID=A0A2T7PQ79_POMCA|nr:hypothetical protein C0Q70_02513 [Pomacea canaliculata]